MELLGLTKEDVTIGMVAFMSVVVGLVISLYAAWRIGAVRAEEERRTRRAPAHEASDA